MSKKNYILIFFSIAIIYLIYSNRYLLTIAFDYFTAPKDAIVEQESKDSLDSDVSLEDFLNDADKKRQSDSSDSTKDKDQEPIAENTENPAKKSILTILKKPKKEEATPNIDPEQQVAQKNSLETIKTKYMKDFSALELSFKINIDSLIGSALGDYKSGKYSKMDIAKKYLDQGKAMEENSDAAFYVLLEDMEKELKSNGHPLDITNDIKTYYEGYKKTEKNKLVDKGMSIVKTD
jgi:hypothetical protein